MLSRKEDNRPPIVIVDDQQARSVDLALPTMDRMPSAVVRVAECDEAGRGNEH